MNDTIFLIALNRLGSATAARMRQLYPQTDTTTIRESLDRLAKDGQIRKADRRSPEARKLGRATAREHVWYVPRALETIRG